MAVVGGVVLCVIVVIVLCCCMGRIRTMAAAAAAKAAGDAPKPKPMTPTKAPAAVFTYGGGLLYLLPGIPLSRSLSRLRTASHPAKGGHNDSAWQDAAIHAAIHDGVLLGTHLGTANLPPVCLAAQVAGKFACPDGCFA